MERLEDAERTYVEADRAGLLFPAPRAPRGVVERTVRGLPEGSIADLRWPSGYSAIACAYDDWVARCPNTRTAHARWFRHRTPRNTLICLHGWGAGAFPFEAQAYRASWLYGLGMDVIFATLPFHARRANRTVGRPLFPSTDPFCSNEGFAQAVFDVRALMALLRHRGIERVAVTGMSLGGFTSALLATVDPDLEAAIPIVPFASLPRMMWEYGEGTQAKQDAIREGLSLEKFEAAYRATSPLHRAPKLPPERMLFIAGQHDRVTPVAQARLLQQHFSTPQGQPRLEVFRGSHLVQTDRRALFRALAKFLAERGFIELREKLRAAAGQ